MEHIVSEGLVQDFGFERFRSYDYGGALINDLKYEDLGSDSRQPVAYSLKLLNDIREHGILQPIVVVKNPTMDGFLVVEGHHRIILARDFNLLCPLYLIHCDCPTSMFDIYCEFVENFTDSEYRRGLEAGWVW